MNSDGDHGAREEVGHPVQRWPMDIEDTLRECKRQGTGSQLRVVFRVDCNESNVPQGVCYMMVNFKVFTVITREL